MEGVHKIWKCLNIIKLRFCFSSMILLMSTRFLGGKIPFNSFKPFQTEEIIRYFA